MSTAHDASYLAKGGATFPPGAKHCGLGHGCRVHEERWQEGLNAAGQHLQCGLTHRAACCQGKGCGTSQGQEIRIWSPLGLPGTGCVHLGGCEIATSPQECRTVCGCWAEDCRSSFCVGSCEGSGCVTACGMIFLVLHTRQYTSRLYQQDLTA